LTFSLSEAHSLGLLFPFGQDGQNAPAQPGGTGAEAGGGGRGGRAAGSDLTSQILRTDSLQSFTKENSSVCLLIAQDTWCVCGGGLLHKCSPQAHHPRSWSSREGRAQKPACGNCLTNDSAIDGLQNTPRNLGLEATGPWMPTEQKFPQRQCGLTLGKGSSCLWPREDCGENLMSQLRGNDLNCLSIHFLWCLLRTHFPNHTKHPWTFLSSHI
jgi:hypothetical protein